MRPLLTLSALSFVLAATASLAAGWVPVQRLDASGLAPGTSGVRLGAAVGVDVHYGPNTVRALYVGAPYATAHYSVNNTDYAGAGVVYVFSPVGGWHVSQVLSATPPQANAHFGAAIAVQNGIIVVGEPDFDNLGHVDAGRVSFFEDYGDTAPNFPEPFLNALAQRTVAFDGARLGASVAVSGVGRVSGGVGTWTAEGAPGLQDLGCAYIDHFNDVLQREEKGSVCGNASGGAFGAAVAVQALSDTNLTLVVGAPGEAQNDQAAAGAAHVYVLNNNMPLLIDDLAAPNPALIDVFGSSVAIDSQRIYVGATGRDQSGIGRTGSVSLFKPAFLIGYDFDTEVFPTNGAHAGDLCGASVYPNFSTGIGFVMGCPGSDGLVTNEGFARTVYPFPFLNGTIWVDQVLSAADLPHGADDLGRSAVLVGDHAYAGGPLHDDAVGADNGTLRIFATDAIFADGFD